MIIHELFFGDFADKVARGEAAAALGDEGGGSEVGSDSSLLRGHVTVVPDAAGHGLYHADTLVADTVVNELRLKHLVARVGR